MTTTNKLQVRLGKMLKSRLSGKNQQHHEAAVRITECRASALVQTGVYLRQKRGWLTPSHGRGSPAELRHAHLGLHLSTLCFTFQQAPVLGWS